MTVLIVISAMMALRETESKGAPMQSNAGSEAGAKGQARIEGLLRELTVAEKVSLLAGSSMWHSTPVERLAIPAIKVSDGPNGAWGGGSFIGGGVTSACFPVAISLGATWDPELVAKIGQALGQETRSKGAQLLLAPTINIHRSPLNGRNFECFSEDPYLSARMAVAYISGLQQEGIGATVKHFVCNDSEFERHTISSEVDERTLREIYLPAFQAAVQEAGSWAVMSSYNRVNGVYTGEHRELLLDILKSEWGFDGLVMSDWFGTKSTVAAANNGLDLEMPGPPRWRGEQLLAAVEAGDVYPQAIDDSVRRLLNIIERAGAFEHSPDRPEQADDRPEHRALIRKAGAEASVLLRNEGKVLPLDAAGLRSIAIIGPNAKTAQIMGGGSAQVNAHYAVAPYEAIAAAAGDGVQILYKIGCTNHKLLPRLDAELMASNNRAERGFEVAYFNNTELDGEPVHIARTTVAEQVWLGDVAPDVQPRNFSARLHATFTPQESGEHRLGLSSAGLSRLFVDGREIVDNWTQQTRGDSYFGTGSAEVAAPIELLAGRAYDLRLDYSSRGATLLAGVRLGYLPPVAHDSIARAASIAAGADVALVFVGLNGDWESEGHDRPDMELVGRQNELVEQVAAANPNTVVVLQTGSPVSMPWLERVAAVVQAWYPGQECGNAIADVLFGTVNPSAKLTQSFPARLEDNPAFINYPGENGRVRYGEGIFVGYRYYETKHVAVAFPFGYGLSYTSFGYSNLRLAADTIGPDDRLDVTVDITNTGSRAGKEVVQLYVRDVEARVRRPFKELKAFAKVALEPGTTTTVGLAIDRRSLAFWDDARHAWVAEAGEFELLVGGSSQDIRQRATFRLREGAVFGGPGRQRKQLSIDSALAELLADDAARAVLERHLPEFLSPQLGMVAGMALVQVAGFDQERFPEQALRAIAADLQALNAVDHLQSRTHGM